MASPVQTKPGWITRLYRGVTHLHSGIPYHLSRSGWTFPTWHYFFEVTRRCNLRCKMCQYIDWLETVPTRVQADGELTTDEWLNVIDQTNRFSLITFTGGEVFVRKDFMRIFEHACSKRRVHFISNATMLTDERAKRCAELAPNRFGGKGFNFAGVSIDGTREIHDTIRAQRGAYDKSMNGIRALAQYRKESGKRAPLIHINTVIQSENLDCLRELPAIMAEAGADVLNLLTEMRSHDIPNLGQVDPGTFTRSDFTIPTITRAKLDESLRATLEQAARAGIEVRLPRMPYEELLNHYDAGYDLADFECRSIWTNLYVGSKGGVYPCFIYKVGNVREQSLKEIWNSPKLRDFRRRRREGGFAVCRGCCELEHSGKKCHSREIAPAPEAEAAIK
ncbi:MAG: radical SAM protein [Candidatus Hydrogenedentes bacterium]|nr:radical SAM protein [Candidatus Hydrogenedentota bacterium]